MLVISLERPLDTESYITFLLLSFSELQRKLKIAEKLSFYMRKLSAVFLSLKVMEIVVFIISLFGYIQNNVSIIIFKLNHYVSQESLKQRHSI